MPFLAHEWLASTSGSYKWMLYGDDDTVWFLPGVMKVVEGLDPELPWLLTGTSCARQWAANDAKTRAGRW